MQPLYATVKKGRLTLDEPCDLPDGKVIVLVPLEELLEVADADGQTIYEPLFDEPSFKEPEVVTAASLIQELQAL